MRRVLIRHCVLFMNFVIPIPIVIQGKVLVRGSYNGLPTVTCQLPPPMPGAPWWQRMPWIFIFVALAAAALLVAFAW